jgi:hypothetical protein
LMATATAMADSNGKGDGQLQRQRQRQWQWSRRRQRKWQWQWKWQQPRRGRPLQRKGCLFMWQQCAVLLEGQHLASTPMDTKESAFVMGVTLLRVFPPFQGGGLLTAHHGLSFCLLLTTTVQFTEQPSVCPPTLFRRSRTLSAD